MKKPVIIVICAWLVAATLLAACAPAATPASPTAAPAAKSAATTEAAKPASTSPAAQTAATAKPKPAAAKVTITTSSAGLVAMPGDLGKKKGFFAEENLEVDIQQLKADVAVKAIVAGEVDFTFNIGSAVRASAQGVPVKGVLVSIARPYHVIIARPEIKEVKDLKGKSIGIDTVGSSPEYMARTVVQKYGMDPDKDVTMVQLGGNPERLAGVKGGAVQAAVIEALYGNKGVNEGLKVLVKVMDVMDMALAGLSTSDKMIKEKPDVVLRVVRATVKSLKFIMDPKNKSEIIDYMVKDLGATQAEAEATYPDIMRAFSTDGSAREDVLMQDVKTSIERAGGNPNTKFTDIFDTSFVEKVKTGG